MKRENATLLNIEHLSLGFDSKRGVIPVLNDVTVSAEKGKMLGIVGESGSGKTVLSHAILKLLAPTARIASGRIDFLGENMLTQPEAAMRKIRGSQISMIFQNPRGALNPIRPVGKQVADTILAHENILAKEAKKRAIEQLDRVRIADPGRRAKAYPFELSGGMCQRVMIAQALACRPKLLIADEPTTGLDTLTQKAVMDMMSELAQSEGASVILITHDLGLAAKYCDRIAVMQQGHLVENELSEKLLSNPQDEYTCRLIRSTPYPGVTLDKLGQTD